jgi:glycosyltransferase involved in cell wall biosynthesis
VVAAHHRRTIMKVEPGEGLRPWLIVTDYPRWPSPYFAHLHRHSPPDLPLSFRPDLPSGTPDLRPGVLNLHRLKRLYHDDAAASRTARAAETLLETLGDLRRNGWRLVWTVHNLKPIDGTAPAGVDDIVTAGVLDLAEVVLCHTNADAGALRSRTDATVRVAGWAGLDPPTQPPTGQIAGLMPAMRAAPLSFLLLGHITRYKDVPATVRAFLATTSRAHLTIAGTAADQAVADELSSVVSASDGRVTWHNNRVPPEQAGHLYAAADAAVCPYSVGDGFDFFGEVILPSSVATATSFHVPVIAPDLPAIAEITDHRPRWLASAAEGIGLAMAAAEAELHPRRSGDHDARFDRPRGAAPRRWQHIGEVYRSVASQLIPGGSLEDPALPQPATTPGEPRP